MDDEEYNILDEEYYIDDRPVIVPDWIKNMSREELLAACERIKDGKEPFEDDDERRRIQHSE